MARFNLAMFGVALLGNTVSPYFLQDLDPKILLKMSRGSRPVA